MGIYLHKFETEEEFDSVYNSSDYLEPWVSYTVETEKVDYNKQPSLLDIPLTFEVLSNGTINFGGTNAGSGYTLTIEYSKNGGAWTEITATQMDVDLTYVYTGGTAIEVSAGDIVQFRGNNLQYTLSDEWNTSYGTCSFTPTTCRFKLSGNIMSLINSTDFTNLTILQSGFTFNSLFGSCTGLTDAGNLLLPATTLANYCYYGMFAGCTSLTTAPELPATTLAESCYSSMFAGCTSLTTAPELPATTLAESCYANMFNGCTDLNYIKCLATDISASYCTSNWVEDVQTNSGTFIAYSCGLDWTYGSNIPSNWTVYDKDGNDINDCYSPTN